INSSTPGNTTDWSANLGNLTNWAFKNVTSIPDGVQYVDVLIKDYFDLEFRLNCVINYTAPGSIITLVEPTNTTYNHTDVSIRVTNSTEVDQAWYRNSTGSGWSQNYTLSYISGEWTNSSAIYWSDNHYRLQVFANDTAGLEYVIEEYFTIDTKNPYISITFPANGTLLTDTTTWINGTVNGTGSMIVLLALSDSDNFTIVDSPLWQENATFSVRNQTALNGNYTLRIWVVDHGLLINSSLVYFAVDNLAPNLTITEPQQGSGVSGDIWFNGTTNGTGSLSTLYFNDSRFSVVIDPNNTRTSNFALRNNTAIPDGNYTLNLTLVDQANLKDEKIITIYIDNQNPTISVTEPSSATVSGILWINGTVNGTSSPLTLYFNDSRLDTIINPNGTFNGSFALRNNTILPDGSFTLNLTVVDDVGLKSEQIVTVYIDNSVPTFSNININGKANNSAVSGTLIWINGTVNATGSTITSISTNGSFILIDDPTGLQVGDFSFRNNSAISGNYVINISTIDDVGYSNYVLIYFTVDNVAPLIDITTPLNYTILTSSTIWINGTMNGTGSNILLMTISDNTNFTIEIDPSGQSDGIFSIRNQTTLYGNYSLIVWVFDEVMLSNSSILNFSVDYMTPNLTITVPATNVVTGAFWINGTTNGTATKSILYFNDSRFSVDINPNNTLASNFALYNNTIIPNGPIWINLTLVDQANFKDEQILFVYVDNSLPDIIITAPSSSAVNVPLWFNGTVNGTGSPLTFYYNDTRFDMINSNPNGTLYSGFSLNNNTYLLDGLYVLNITVVDLAGFKSEQIIQVWLDNSDPTISITSPLTSIVSGDLWINGTVNGTSSQLLLYFNDSRFNVVLNPNSTVAGNFALLNNTVIPDGNFSLNLTVVDSVNFKVEHIISIYIDNSIPDITLDLNNGTIQTGSVIWINGTINSTGSEIASFSINDSRFTLQTSNPIGQPNATFAFNNNTVLYDGRYSLRINLTDLAGFENYTIIYFYVDNLVNLLPIIHLTNPGYNGSAIKLDDRYGPDFFILEGDVWGVSNDTDTIWVNSTGVFNWTLLIDPSGTAGGNFVFVNASPIVEGSYWINITVNNTDGNATSLLRYFYIDITPPITPPNFTYTIMGNNVTLIWDDVGDLTNVTYIILRNSVNIANTTSLTFTDVGLLPGTYNYTILVIDNAGNICAVAAQRMVQVGGGGSSPPDYTLLIILIIIIIGAVGAIGGTLFVKKRKSSSSESYFPPQKIKLEELIIPEKKQVKPIAKVISGKPIKPKKRIIPPPKSVPTKSIQKPIKPKSISSTPKIPAILAKTAPIKPKMVPTREKPIIVRPKGAPPKPKPIVEDAGFVYHCEHCNKYFKVKKEGIYNCPNCHKFLKLFKG
ncbi:MAG: beta strand repeat-containing protein, partial [Candidatus Helarchaeota archaeon]